jgi:hypothetical protein
VAVIDDGVDFSHPDLSARRWVNPGETPNNGVDDDANGYVDDVNGWDVCHRDNTVHDDGDDSHGTHVSGTIAASVNNQGIVGVAPNVEIMALKFLSDNGTGPGCNSTAGAIEAIGYAKKMGVKISNNSWGGGAFSQALKDAIDSSGQLFVAAAGNGGPDSVGDNNDATPMYPASYASANIVSVAAANNRGSLGGFSNYGKTSVDISAPGVSILSSVPGNTGDPAAVLSSVGTSGGKALTAGFGAEEIGTTAKQASFFGKAFQAIGRGSQQVVLVDDDGSDIEFSGTVDVGPTVAAAIQSATGSPPDDPGQRRRRAVPLPALRQDRRVGDRRSLFLRLGQQRQHDIRDPDPGGPSDPHQLPQRWRQARRNREGRALLDHGECVRDDHARSGGGRRYLHPDVYGGLGHGVRRGVLRLRQRPGR